MQPLDRTYRNLLERTVKEAREVAEAAAVAVLNQLGVGAPKPFEHLSEYERQLRRRLRAHGRQLGDLRNGNGKQETVRLAEEVAYEHWHRMLFARFLAENDLLMYPDPDDPVAISLGDWINRRKDDIASGFDGAREKLAAAQSLKKKLELILEGEFPHDIFVRWKPVHKQPMGWEPDLNDGVRLNIRPFMTVGDVRKRGAGILRDKPNIHWKKDRGKDVPSAPWYHLGPEYGGKEGDRINDHHLTLEEKQAAREKRKNE